jgi:predicted DNA-binding transcriptional regulator AlpA
MKAIPLTVGRRLMLKLLNDLPQESSIPASQTPTLPKLILDGFLRREELAQQLGLSPRTIDRWESLRKGPPRVCVGRTVLYNVDSVREWLQSNEQQKATVRVRRPIAGKRRQTSL